MVPKEILEIIVCPTCREGAVRLGGGRKPALICGMCQEAYPIVRGIIDLMPRRSGKPIKHYRTEALYDAIARFYDLAAPPMSMFVWGCPPLRFSDWAHRAAGRAIEGRLLVHPVGTGLLVRQIFSVHAQYPIVCVDVSWKMLRQAQARFKRAGIDNVVLIHTGSERLPFVDASFKAIMSFNGLNGFYDRHQALAEMSRVLEPEGSLVGSSLCRGLEWMADLAFNVYERWGIYPILRSRSYLIREIEAAIPKMRIHWETFGAVVFFLVERDRQAPTDS